jgi:hypothetical protein
MARRSDPLTLEVPPDLAFQQVREVARRQGWTVTSEHPPPRRWYPPELRLKGGASHAAGSGRLRIQFTPEGTNGTRASVTTRWAATDSRAEASVRVLAKGLGLDPEALHLTRYPDTEAAPGWQERSVVRLIVACVIVATVLAFALVRAPENLPATALGQPPVYHLEVALLVFYGGFLLLTPAFWGLIRGRLPTEISSRGAKYTEVGESADAALKATGQQSDLTLELSDRLTKELAVTKGQVKTLAEQAGITLDGKQDPQPRS